MKDHTHISEDALMMAVLLSGYGLAWLVIGVTAGWMLWARHVIRARHAKEARGAA